MGTILCPTRGGEASYPNQDRAIALAKERDAQLIFLYVSDVRFLFKGSGALLGSLEEELDEMGDFLLLMAQERAEKQGVHAETEVRRGSFREAIAEVISEYQVTTVVFGTPGQEHRVTTDEYLEALADDLETELDVEVMMTKDGTLVPHTSGRSGDEI